MKNKTKNVFLGLRPNSGRDFFPEKTLTLVYFHIFRFKKYKKTANKYFDDETKKFNII